MIATRRNGEKLRDRAARRGIKGASVIEGVAEIGVKIGIGVVRGTWGNIVYSA
jgi:hypothetical protein